ncbi:MAG: enoyl-CoA hydratase [Kiloniellales bacterium]|nr:enoyl-CoA hydratase [Kiloniellales bacterium]
METAADTLDREALVLRSDAEGVATLTLNRPKAYNALSLEMMRSLRAVLEAIACEPEVRAVVLQGAGKGFCAGHDLKELRANPGRPFYEETFAECSRLMLAIVRLPIPVIAKVHGIATAAGCQLVATCDLAVAAETARFATPGVNIGLFCSTPMVALSRNVPRKQAMEMLLLGEMQPARRGLEIGLINRAVPEAELDAAVEEMARTLLSKSPLILKIGKEAFYRQAEMDLEAAYAYTAEVMTENMLTRDAGEGIDAFIEKRHPSWTGA